MSEWAKYWWSSVTGPHNFCDEVAQALRGRSNVCLFVPDDLPWRSDMRGGIESSLRRWPEMEDFFFEVIDVADECADADDVGRYLLRRYAPLAVATGFRGRGKIQQYILNNHVLEKRILWIKGMNAQQEGKWLQFCRDYVPENEADGRIVIEMHFAQRENPRRNLAVISYRNRIGSYDLTLFDSIYLSMERRDYAPLWQQYAAVAAAQLCHTDAEIAQALMDRCDFAREEPITALRDIAADAMYLRRGRGNEAHILSLVRNGDVPAIEKLIWKAQLQLLFPLAELERSSFIEIYRDEIAGALAEKYIDPSDGRACRVYQFGELLDDPENAELGTLYRMTRLRCDADDERYLLYIPDRNAKDRLELLHTLRNALAHGRCLPVESVAAFIDAHPFKWK